jgi:Kef-type K+ transport system membrane component KefB
MSGGTWDALYLAVAAAMSSTVIIVKALYDKRELDTLPGRVTLGVLVIQDLFAILFLAVQPSLDQLMPSVVLISFGKVGVLVLTALALSRYVLPPVFKTVARLPELVLVGAIAWCFLVGELGERLGLSREMGALIAGVCLSTFPYALDVTAKVTGLRDFFVTLFFVGLGMKIPMPTLPLMGWALVFAVFTVGSRMLTTFLPLYRMKQGLRASLLPSINLANVSEFSLVVLSLGVAKAHFGNPATQHMATFAFVLMATLGSFGIMKSDSLVRWLVPKLKRRGLEDLDDSTTQIHARKDSGHGARILVLGFFRTASSLLEELARKNPGLLEDLAVVDFNPQVNAGLKARGVRVIYGDISQRDTLVHAGIEQAEILICTVPDSILKGSTNARLVRQLRELNPGAKIIATAEVLSEVPRLYEAGANFVSVPRLAEASEIAEALLAAEANLLDQKRTQANARLAGRSEVLP